METIPLQHQHMEVKKQSSPFSSLFLMTSSSSDCNGKRKAQDQDLCFENIDLVQSQMIEPSNKSEAKLSVGIQGSKKLKTEKNSELYSYAEEGTPSSPRSIQTNQDSEDQQPITTEPSTADKSNYTEYKRILSSNNTILNTNNSSASDVCLLIKIPEKADFLPERIAEKIDFSTRSKLKRWFKIMDEANVSSKAVENYLEEKAIKSEKHYVKSFAKANRRALDYLEKSLFQSETPRELKIISKKSDLISHIESYQIKGLKLSLKLYIDI